MNTFGVEFEYSSGLIRQSELRKRMRRVFDEYYDSISDGMWAKSGRPSPHSFSKHWVLKYDCSCGYEVASKILESSPEGIKELIRVSKVLNKKQLGKAKHPTNSQACGLHIHISREKLTEAAIDNFMHFLFLSSRVIHKMTQSTYRQTRGGYGSTCLSTYNRLRFFRDPTIYGMGAVRQYTRHDTIEVRLSRSLHDSHQIAAYVKFLLTAMSICKGLGKGYFLKTYKRDSLMRGFFNKADVEEFFIDEEATHGWLESSKKATLAKLKITQ